MTDMTPTHPTQASEGEVRHTPGQWKASVGVCYDQVEVEGGPLVCFAAIREESKANARLIAAAPDLLAALRDLMDLESRGRIMPIGKEWDAARAAIARATSLPNEANQ